MTCKVVTVMNMKGGVGKTTVCMHLGNILARYRPTRKVLLIDYDPQFNMSQAMLTSKRYRDLENGARTCLQILQDPDSDIDPFKIQTPESDNPPSVASLTESIVDRASGAKLDLIPSTLDLMYIAVGTASGDIETVEKRFAKFIKEARKKYHVVMIDCHPAGSILTRTSLRNSDDVLIPVAPQAYAGRGVALMKTFVEANVSANGQLKPHIVFNMIPRSGGEPDVVGTIRRSKALGKHCLRNSLRWYTAFSQPTEGRGFVWTSGRPYSTEALRNALTVAREFAERIDVPRSKE